MLSFVIPVLNEAEALPVLLCTLRSGFPRAEIIVVDGGSRDGSVAAAIPYANAVLMSQAGRALQMNLGAAAAEGDWLVFLHADTLPEFSEDMLLSQVETNQSWGFCKVGLQGGPWALRLISWAMNQRSRLSSVATGDQMLFVRRTLFDDLGGYADVPLMEDVEICKRLRRSHRPLALPLRVLSSGRRWEQQGVLVTILRMWALRFAYWLGVSPHRLWNHYYGASAVQSEASTRR